MRQANTDSGSSRGQSLSKVQAICHEIMVIAMLDMFAMNRTFQESCVVGSKFTGLLGSVRALYLHAWQKVVDHPGVRAVASDFFGRNLPRIEDLLPFFALAFVGVPALQRKGLASGATAKSVQAAVVSWLRRSEAVALQGGTAADLGMASYEKYCDQMALNGVWGDNLTLFAACHCFKVQIRVISSSAGGVAEHLLTVEGRQQRVVVLFLAHLERAGHRSALIFPIG
eukprot:m51a1_g12543 hypothetical protein (227) ;mRNA; f:707-4018